MYIILSPPTYYTLSDAWSGVNWADLMAAQGAFGSDFNRSILRPKHRAHYRSGRPVIIIKIGPKGALGSYEMRSAQFTPLQASDEYRYLHL